LKRRIAARGESVECDSFRSSKTTEPLDLPARSGTTQITLEALTAAVDFPGIVVRKWRVRSRAAAGCLSRNLKYGSR